MANLINPKVIDIAFETYRPKYNYIADEIATLVKVNNAGGLYKKIGAISLKPENMVVGNSGTSFVEDDYRDVSFASYTAIKKGKKAFLKDEDIQNLKEEALIDLVQQKLGIIQEKILLDKEITVQSLIANNGNSTTPSVKWDGENPTIEKDIRNAISTFRSYAGIDPNVLIVPKQVWDVIVLDSTLREVWKIVPSIAEKEKIKLSSLLKLLFDNFEKILIPNAQKDVAKKGKEASYQDIWGDTVVLLYAEEKGTTETFTWGSRFLYQDLKKDQWTEKDPDGVVIRVQYAEDYQVVCSNAIYKLTDVLS